MFLVILSAVSLAMVALGNRRWLYYIPFTLLVLLVAWPLLVMRTDWMAYSDFADANWRFLAGDEIADPGAAGEGVCQEGNNARAFAAIGSLIFGVLAWVAALAALAGCAVGTLTVGPTSLVSLPFCRFVALRQRCAGALAFGLCVLTLDGLLWRSAAALERVACGPF